MQDWARRAHAVVGDGPEPVLPERSLHLSRILDGRRELSGSFDPEGGAVIATALRLAATGDVEGEPPVAPPSGAPTPSSTCAAGSSTTNSSAVAAATAPTSTSSPPSTTSNAAGPAGSSTAAIIDPATVGRLVCDAGIHRVVTDGRSAILDYGTTTRTVPARLFNALVIRDRHCRYPGCDRPPDWTEAHHVRWITHGGATALDNLVLVCSRHHHLLHSPGWHAKLLPDTTIEITDPQGHIHTSDPPALRPPLPLRE